MGTTAEKLTYLNATKGKIKDGINSLGGSIDSNTTFREYATQLDSIYNRLPKVSGTGSNITLTPTLKGRLGSVLKGDTYQQTYTGKNLLNNTLLTQQTTKNNITATPNSDGSITLNGTTSANTYFNLANIDFGNTSFNSIDGGSSQYIASTSNSSTDARIDYSRSNKYTFITILNGVTVNNLKIYPMIRLASVIDDTFEPYVGGQASPNPSYPQNIQCAEGIQNISDYGKNLWDNSQIINKGNYLIKNDTGFKLIKENNENRLSDIYNINLEPNTTYTISCFKEGTTSNQTIFCQWIKEDNSILWSPNINNTVISFTTGNYRIKGLKFYLQTTEENNTYVEISNLQIEKGSTSTSYQPYQTPQTVQIDLGDIKLYSGDKITGTPDNWSIVRENGEIILDGSESGWFGFRGSDETYSYRVFGNTNLVLANANANVKSNYFTKNLSAILNANENGIYIYVSNALYISIDKNLISSVEPSAFKTWLSTHNTKVVYELATPTTTPITDTNLISQLNALYNLQSYDDTTNISVDGDLPMILEVSALKGE